MACARINPPLCIFHFALQLAASSDDEAALGSSGSLTAAAAPLPSPHASAEAELQGHHSPAASVMEDEPPPPRPASAAHRQLLVDSDAGGTALQLQSRHAPTAVTAAATPVARESSPPALPTSLSEAAELVVPQASLDEPAALSALDLGNAFLAARAARQGAGRQNTKPKAAAAAAPTPQSAPTGSEPDGTSESQSIDAHSADSAQPVMPPSPLTHSVGPVQPEVVQPLDVPELSGQELGRAFLAAQQRASREKRPATASVADADTPAVVRPPNPRRRTRPQPGALVDNVPQLSTLGRPTARRSTFPRTRARALAAFSRGDGVRFTEVGRLGGVPVTGDSSDTTRAPDAAYTEILVGEGFDPEAYGTTTMVTYLCTLRAMSDDGGIVLVLEHLSINV